MLLETPGWVQYISTVKDSPLVRTLGARQVSHAEKRSHLYPGDGTVRCKGEIIH